MANRFARKIRAGEIESEDELKSNFKSLAKVLHPDIAGAGFHLEFVRVREEFESALRNFAVHRFSAGGSARSDSAFSGTGARKPADPFAELTALLRRNFPKKPSHEKERHRYGYARWRFRNSVACFGPEYPSRFDAFERELIILKDNSLTEAKDILSMLNDLIEYKKHPLSALRTAIELEFDALRERAPLSAEALAFLGRIVAELGEGNILR